MKVNCISCGYELNLDHRIFDDYAGPVKCFSCNTIMEIKTARGRGIVQSEYPLAIFQTERNLALVNIRN